MKQHQPLVSWGLPVYNGSKTLPVALNSMQQQTYKSLEFIISDNASKDSTQQLCESFCKLEPRAKYIRQPENIGPTRNFRYVLDHAQGDYFLWGAHDDFWQPNYIEALVKVLESHPTAVLITPRIKHVDDHGQPTGHKDDKPAPGTSRYDNLKSLYDDHACSWIYGLFRRDFLLENFHHIEDIYGGDLLWMVEIVLKHTVAGTDQTCMFKRAGKNGFIPKSELDHLRCWRLLERYLLDACHHLVIDSTEQSKIITLTQDFISRKTLNRKNPLKYIKRQTMKSWLWLTEPAPKSLSRLQSFSHH